MSKTAIDHRRREVAQIHIAKAQLNMADDTYRNIIRTITHGRTDSSGEMDYPERRALIDHFVKIGFRVQPAKRTAPPKNAAGDKQALVYRLGKMLSDQGREWAYIDAVAKRMFKIEKAEWCDTNQLHSLVGILAKDARRHDRPV